MNEKHMLATFSVVSLITMGIGLYNSFKRGKEDSNEADSLRKQEEDISKELEKMNNLQLLLATKAEEIEVTFIQCSSSMSRICPMSSLLSVLERFLSLLLE